MRLLAVLGALGAASPEAVAQDPTPTGRSSIAVMALETPKSFSSEVASALSAALTETLDELRAFDVISNREVKALVARERIEAILQEEEPDFERLARLGDRLEADFIIVGGVVHEGGTGQAHLQLLRVDPPGALERVSRAFEGPPEASIDVQRVLVRLLVRDLLAERSGRVEIVASEEGATVHANGVIVGTTPLDEPIELAEGLNTIEVDREGFIRHREDVEVERDRTSTLEVVLVPSREYIESYRGAVLRQRWIGWGMVGLGAVAAGSSIALFSAGSNRADELNRDIEAYNALEPSQQTEAEFDALRARESDIATLDVLTIVGAAVAVASFGTGTALLLTNQPLDRYDGFVRARAEPRVRLDLGLGSLKVCWAF